MIKLLEYNWLLTCQRVDLDGISTANFGVVQLDDRDLSG
jgi:hypothetical protein